MQFFIYAFLKVIIWQRLKAACLSIRVESLEGGEGLLEAVEDPFFVAEMRVEFEGGKIVGLQEIVVGDVGDDPPRDGEKVCLLALNQLFEKD